MAQPSNLFTQPFAASGDKNIIPNTLATPSITATASQQYGFPTITSTPIAQGGIAPPRADFNGILYMLSCYAMYAQQGGLYAYSNTTDYDPPCIATQNGVLYWCKTANGPTSGHILAPASDTSNTYWIELVSATGVINSASLATVTTSSNGVMLASDKVKLNGIATGAQVNQNAYSSLNVNDNVTLTAGSATSTLKIAAGSDISLSGDSATNTFTVSLPDTISADTTGNAATATTASTCSGNSATATTASTATTATSAGKLTSAKTLSLAGGATGSVTTDWSGNPSLNVTALDAAKLTGTASVATTGNANTATTLQTARTIALSGGATGTATSFNGGSNITIPVTSLDASKLTGTLSLDTTGNAATATTALTCSGNSATATLASTANIASSANSCTGNAATATSLTTARTIAISGGATGTATSFDGTANITIPVTSLDASKLTGTASVNTTGTSAGVVKTVTAGSVADLMNATVGTNDYAKVTAGGSANAGYLELATGNEGTESIYMRQYGSDGTVAHEATLMDRAGNTTVNELTATYLDVLPISSAATEGGEIRLHCGTDSSYGITLDTTAGKFRVFSYGDTAGSIFSVSPQTGELTFGGYNVECVSAIGSNYIRWTNGMQICWGSLSTVHATVYTVTFPAAFSGTDYKVVASSVGVSSSVTFGAASTIAASAATSTTCYIAQYNTASANMALAWLAVGRWC